MKKFLIASGVAVLAFATVAGAQSTVFSTNLTVGSTGADVSALQTALISAGHSIPAIAAGSAKGYFGSQTKVAVQAYQTSKGIPSTGFVGPLTRAALNGTAAVVSTTVTCPAGYTCTANAGTVTSGTVSTTGQEGTLTLTSSNSGLASSIYEGDSMVKVLGLKLEAKSSDINVQRIKIDLGTSTAIYNKVLSKIYVMDGSTVLASSDLNSNTVVKDGSNYYVTLTGFSSVVKKDTSKVLNIAVDVKGSIDTGDRTTSRTIQTASSAVRGVDGAGLDQYTTSSSGTASKSFTISNTLVDAAALKVSLNTSSPKATTVIASAGANQDEADKVSALVFNVKAEKDTVLINEISVLAAGTAVTDGSVTTLYLFDGSTEVDNATASTTGNTTFSNVDLTVAKDTTKVLTVKVDVRSASSSARTLTVSIDGDTTSTVDAENTVGDAIANAYLSGSATGETMQVQKAGAVYTLVGTPTLPAGRPNGSSSASSTYTASFAFDLSAQGSDLTVAASGAFIVGIYKGDSFVASSTGTYSKPTSGVTGSGPYTIADGSAARFNVDFGFVAPNGSYVAGDTVHARLMSATTNLGTVTYISDTFRTGSQTL